jgi:hypothetical protein
MATVQAAECPDREETTLQTNEEFLVKGKALAAEALEHAKLGHGDEAKKAGYAAVDALACIVSSWAGAKLQSPVAKIRTGSLLASRGKQEKAVAILQKGVDKLNKVKMTAGAR